MVGGIKSNTTAFGLEGGFFINYAANSSSRTWRLANDIETFGDFQIQQSTTQTGSTYLTRLYITNGGNVGINTTTPAYTLDVKTLVCMNPFLL